MIKIIVDSEEEKKQLLEASRHIHDLRDVDTDISMVNTITHLYMAPHLIEVQPKLENLNFDDETSMGHYIRNMNEKVEIPVGALYSLLGGFYQGGGEPDSYNERLEWVLKE